jgi:hypothetical protein
MNVSINRLWIVSILISLFIVAVPMGIALTLLPLIAFAIPVAGSDLWQELPRDSEQPC